MKISELDEGAVPFEKESVDIYELSKDIVKRLTPRTTTQLMTTTSLKAILLPFMQAAQATTAILRKHAASI